MGNSMEPLNELRGQIELQLAGTRNFGARLKALRQQQNMTLDDLAARSGISKAYLSQIENGRVDPPRDDKVRRLEAVFGERPSTLVELAHLARVPDDVRERFARLQDAVARAEEAIPRAASQAPAPPSDAAKGDNLPAEAVDETISAPRHVGRRIPIINRVAAGYPAEFTDLGYPAGVADEYLGEPPGLHDANAFALRVVGDSMAPRYHEGDIVLFSPQSAVHSGDDCYVRFTPECASAQGATFKRVYFDNETTARLQPLNNSHAPLLVPLKEIAGLYRAVFRYEAL
jgi:repressor LexA